MSYGLEVYTQDEDEVLFTAKAFYPYYTVLASAGGNHTFTIPSIPPAGSEFQVVLQSLKNVDLELNRRESGNIIAVPTSWSYTGNQFTLNTSAVSLFAGVEEKAFVIFIKR